MRLLALLLGLGLVGPLHAAGDFEAWKKDSQRQYGAWREAQDRQFGEYLDRQWREFRVFSGERRDSAPKPVIPPSVVPDAAPTPPPPRAPALTPPAPVSPSSGPSGEIAVACFGLEFRLPPSALPSLKGAVDAAAVSRWWKLATEADDGKTAAALAELRDARHLSDWNMRQLVTAYVAAAEGNWNSRIAREWFYLTRLGYQARVAIDEGQLALLARTDHVLYETRYLQIDGERYYLLASPSAGSGRFTTYEGNHPTANRQVSMAQEFAVWDGVTPSRTRQLHFAWKDRNYTLSVAYHPGLIEYLSTIPPTDLGVYFNTTESSAVHRQLESQLRPMLKGMREAEAVDFLLAFVQRAFAYETDEQQFGREHYMFADETIHYPWSDCEDRAVLFARLARELLGLPVIGVSYPGHVATAVALPNGKGRHVEHRGVSYVIADPTYVGATAGMEMPQFAGVTPAVIEIR